MVWKLHHKDKGGLLFARSGDVVESSLDAANLDVAAGSLAPADLAFVSVGGIPKSISASALALSLASLHNHDALYLGINAKAADSNLLDGLDSTAFALAAHAHIQADITGLKTTDSPTWANVNATSELRTAGVKRIDSAGAATLTLADVDNLRLDGNTLVSTNTNGNVILDANGTGQIQISPTGYRALMMRGGNSYGYLLTSYSKLGDSINLTYNYYCDPDGTEHIPVSAGSTSRLAVGYGQAFCKVGATNTAPATTRWLADTLSVRFYAPNYVSWNDDASATKMYLNVSNGYLGLGTTSPQAPLHVAGDASLTGGLYTGGSASAKGTLRLDAAGNATLYSLVVGTSGGGDKAITVYSSTVGAYGRMRTTGNYVVFEAGGNATSLNFNGPSMEFDQTEPAGAINFYSKGTTVNFHDWTTAGNPTRITLYPLTGDLSIAGNATMATATIGSAKCWGRSAAWPASTNDGDYAFNTTLHKWGHYNAGAAGWEAWS